MGLPKFGLRPVGTAVSFACDDYVFSLDAIQKLIDRPIRVEWPGEEIFRTGKLSNAPRPHVSHAGRRGPRRDEPGRVRIPLAATPQGAEDPDSFGRTKRKSHRR